MQVGGPVVSAFKHMTIPLSDDSPGTGSGWHVERRDGGNESALEEQRNEEWRQGDREWVLRGWLTSGR
jgi:hypothetical protein